MLTNLDTQHLAIFFWLITLTIFSVYVFYIKDKQIKSSIPILDKITKSNNSKFKIQNSKLMQVMLISLSIAFLSFIILWPRWWVDSQKIKAQWIDVMFALDVSNSMKALDFEDQRSMYSRLDASKLMISQYVSKNNENRYWLVSFAWDSFTSIPLTTDTNLFLTFLNGVDGASVSKWWTDLVEALTSSLNRFVDSEDRAKIVILVSDWWEEWDDINYSTIKRIINENWVQIFTIWVWSIKWNFIPESQDMFWRIKYKTQNWQRVLTKLYEHSLKKIASNSDWRYFRADNFSSLEKINSEIKSLQKTTIDKEIKWWKKDLYKYLASISFLFFIVWIFL